MIDDKPILALETSESLCGACVYFSEKKYFETNIQLKNSHAEKLFEAIQFVIDSAGILTEDLGSIAVSSGPGSFTGLRIGMSAAKGVAFGASLPIIPVPTFEALALQISTFLKDESEFIVANRVNVEEIYYSKFKVKANNYIFVDNLEIRNRNDFISGLKDEIVFGNVLANKTDIEINKNISAPSPRYIAKWGKLNGEKFLTFNYDYLEPNYLKEFIIRVRKNA